MAKKGQTFTVYTEGVKREVVHLKLEEGGPTDNFVNASELRMMHKLQTG